MKVSKVVLIVVALHVLVIGGIFIFEGCSRVKSPVPQMAENETQPGATNTVAGNTVTPVPEANLTGNTVPAPAPAPAPAPVAPAAKTYVVKKGDSLYKIAKAEKVTIEQLAKANNLTKTSLLKIDQKLTIPTAVAKADAAPAPTAVAGVSTPAPVSTAVAAGNVYEVKSGDSLWKIAKNNSTTVAALKQANNLTKDALKVGQKLTIPSKSASPTASTTVATVALAGDVAGQPTYIVAEGDTAASIAKKHGVKLEDLTRVNKITATSPMRVGDKLVIPVAAPAAASPAVIAPGLIAN